MQVIILKYVQVLCITVFFSNNVNCDKLLLHNEQEDQHLYRIGSCAAECLAAESADGTSPANASSNSSSSTSRSMESCYKLCSEEGVLEKKPPLMQNTQITFNIKLICRDSTSLVIEVRQGSPVAPVTAGRASSSREPNGFPRTNSKDSRQRSNKNAISSQQQARPSKSRRSISGNDGPPINNYNHGAKGVVIGGANNSNETVDYGPGSRGKSAHFIYLIKIQESGSQLADRIVYMSNTSVVKIENLSPNKQYNITATVLSSRSEYIYVQKLQQFRTLPKNYTPGLVTTIDVQSYQTNRNSLDLLDAIMTWKPAPDMTCHYEILCYASNSPDFELKPIDVQQPEELYQYTIHSLKLDSEYVIAVRAKNTKNPERESELQWHTFHTPSCTDWHNSSELCAPENVVNLRGHSVYLSDENYLVNISWDKPRFAPDYYIIKLYDLYPGLAEDELGNSVSRNVSGETTNVIIEFPMRGPQYEIFIEAHANNRNSTQSLLKPLFIARAPTDHWNGGRLAVIILTPVLMVGLTKIFVSFICRRRAKLKRYEQRCEYFKDLEQKAPVDPGTEFEIKVKSIQEILQPIIPLPGDLIAPINDEMEISFDQVKLLDVLGEGAFGLVRKAILIRPIGTYRQVAVKMLKECPSLEDIKEFRREIEVMKSVGVHPHVVGLVGHYTKNINEMMLLTEYCSEGNLLNYLRCEWHKVLRNRNLAGSAAHSKVVCETPALKTSHKKPENFFNFDTSFVNEKKSLAYKNITNHEHNNGTEQCSVSAPQPTTKIIENKLYPLVMNDDDDNGDEANTCCSLGADCLNDLEKTVHNGDGAGSCENKEEIRQTGQKSPTSARAIHCNIRVSGSTQVENQCYYSTQCNEQQQQQHQQGLVVEENVISSSELLEFARQVAVGMEFLARNKVVHRDLAARNVLVCSNKTVKISDFGLSRDIYQENLYRKTGTGKLPIKWLALESLTHQLYTSQSDVWSFGVLLYEICTLGGNPYPLLSTSNLIAKLRSGYRMEQPSSCSKELYELMLICWSALPSDRPTFVCVQNRLEELMEQSLQSNKPVIVLDAIIDTQSTKTTSNENSYLKPVEY